MKELTFVSVLLFIVQISACPPGSVQIGTEDKCLYISNETHFYLDAFRRCMALGGTTAKIDNGFENSVLLTSLPRDANDQLLSLYIGVERKENNVWVYSDGSPLTWTKWAQNEPNNLNNATICARIDPQTGFWLSTECTYSRPFACTISENNATATTPSPSTSISSTMLTTASDVQCPEGWTFYNYTGFCYFAQPYENTINDTRSCKDMEGDLVSIHNKEEDGFVQSLAIQSLSFYTYPFVIGYRGFGGPNAPDGGGSWTDGSPVDYYHCCYYPYHGSTWLIIAGNCGGWVNWAVDQPKKLGFVCKQKAKVVQRK